MLLENAPNVILDWKKRGLVDGGAGSCIFQPDIVVYLQVKELAINIKGHISRSMEVQPPAL